MEEVTTRSLHNVLTSQFTELPVTCESTIFRNGRFLLALYGVEGEPILAFGTVRTGRCYLGTPKLIWCGPHTPRWSFKPIWPIPEGWTAGMSPTQILKLLAQAQRIIELRRQQYGVCQSCGESTMPEHMDPDFHGQPTCYGCMSEQGVVF